MFGRLFGAAKEEPKAAPKPSLQEASANMDLKIQQLEDKIKKSEEEVRTHAAKGSGDAMAKKRAIQALKRKKMYEAQRDQLVQTQFNVETIAIQQEQAEITKTTVEAMTAAKDELKDTQKQVDIGKVEDTMAELEELQADMADMQQILAGPMGDAVDDAELDAELAQIQEEVTLDALSKIGVGPAPSGGYATGQAAAAPAKPQSAEEAEYAKLLAEMSGPTAVPQ
jgi:hypothetical protein